MKNIKVKIEKSQEKEMAIEEINIALATPRAILILGVARAIIELRIKKNRNRIKFVLKVIGYWFYKIYMGIMQ